MNERIRELAEQAELTKGVWAVPDFILEKFAELIVRECAKFLDENSGYDDSNNAWHPEPEDLLKHFGVEDQPVDNVDRILRTVRTRGTKE